MNRLRPAVLALLLATLPAFAADAPLTRDQALERAGAAEMDPDAVIAVLAPFADTDDRRVEESLAFAHFLKAVNGAQPGRVDPAAMAPAIAYAERALAHGSGLGANLLYQIHGDGLGVPGDAARAVAYLRKAAELGDTAGKLNYAMGLYDGSIPTLARDVATACPLLLELAASDEPPPPAIYYLGLVTYRGDCGRPADPEGASELIAIAAKQGVRDAMRDQAKALEFGWAGEKDPAEALRWYAQAAERGDGYSAWRTGMTYVNGEGHPPDAKEAVRWFERAVQAGSLHGHTSLAVMYATGAGVPQDFAKARELYTLAAEAGEAHAYRELAIMQIRGEGQVVDPVAASVSYRQSIALGNDAAPQLAREIDAALDAKQRAEADARFARWQATQPKPD
jgi:hypothetical protein